jgi:hypothetical protein
LGASYDLSTLYACRVSQFPANYAVTDTDITPNNSYHGYLTWNGADALKGETIVGVDRSAESTGNLLIALGSGMIGLSIGIFPLAYENIRRSRFKIRASDGSH